MALSCKGLSRIQPSPNPCKSALALPGCTLPVLPVLWYDEVRGKGDLAPPVLGVRDKGGIGWRCQPGSDTRSGTQSIARLQRPHNTRGYMQESHLAQKLLWDKA